MKIAKTLGMFAILLPLSVKVNAQRNSNKNETANYLHSNKIDLNAKKFLLFSYFTKQAGGAYLALSTDGIHWEQLNGGSL